jgi:hypothetical protein
MEMTIVEKLCDFFITYGEYFTKEDLFSYDKEMYTTAEMIFNKLDESDIETLIKTCLAATRHYKIIDMSIDWVYTSNELDICCLSLVVADLATGVTICSLNNLYRRC